MEVKYYIDKLLIVLEKENKYYLEKEIDEKLFKYMYDWMSEKKNKKN